MQHKEYLSRALDVAINIGFLIVLIGVCFLIVSPFLPLIIWGIVIAIATEPAYRKLRNLFGGRKGFAAIVCTVVLIALVVVPVVMLAGSVLQGIHTLVGHVKDGLPLIPPPPPRVGNWPIIGAPLSNAWQLASRNVSDALVAFTPEVKVVLSKLLFASAGISLAVLQWVLSILIAGYILMNDTSSAQIAHSFARRVFGEKGAEFAHLASATIRSVTVGIIGVALIQSICAAAGFLVARLPGAGLWAIGFLFAAVLQLGAVVLLPAVIYMFAIASTTKAMIFLAWCLIVAVMDNVLKPLLLGRGVPVPVAVVFVGAIGGFVAMGAIGLFVGSILLSVGYKLLLAWVEGPSQVAFEVSERSSSARTAS